MKVSMHAALSLSLLLALGACGQAADQKTAGDAAEGEGAAGVAATIDARQANFKDISKANKEVKAALEEAAPDFEAIAAAATAANTGAAKITGFFPAGSGPESGEETEALATIWSKPEEFKAAADKLVTSSAALAAAAKAKDAETVKSAAADMGGSCKGCHDTFRLKKS